MLNFDSENAPIFDLGRIPDFIENTFRSGRTLFLIDGYDELTAEGQQSISDYLKILLQVYPKTRVVITGAPEYLDGLIGLGFAPLSVAAWNKTHIRQFIRKWGELWTQFVAVEAWAQTGPEQVDPILLNSWLSMDNYKLSPFELTLKCGRLMRVIVWDHMFWKGLHPIYGDWRQPILRWPRLRHWRCRLL